MTTKKTTNKPVKIMKPRITTPKIVKIPQTNKELALELQKVMDGKGVGGVIKHIREMRYLYESLWSDIMAIIRSRFCKQIQVRVERDGGHVFLNHKQPHDYLPNDHAAVILDNFTYHCIKQEFKGWALCSGCGRPFCYTRTTQTILVMTTCPNLRSGTGTILMVEALPIPTLHP